MHVFRQISISEISRVCTCVNVCVTRDNGGHAPADGVIEPHGSVVDVALLGLHAVDVKALHEHPGERGHEEVMQEDGDNRAQELEGRRKRMIKGREDKKSKVEDGQSRNIVYKEKEKRKKRKVREENQG